MLRHLKNFTELAVFAGVSCAIAFLERLNPSLFYPILMLRFSILAYAFYLIAEVENNRVFAAVLGGAVLIGWLGGYWDYLELYFFYNLREIVGTLITLLVFGAVLGVLYLEISKKNEQPKK